MNEKRSQFGVMNDIVVNKGLFTRTISVSVSVTVSIKVYIMPMETDHLMGRMGSVNILPIKRSISILSIKWSVSIDTM